jgi:hypothetical protein
MKMKCATHYALNVVMPLKSLLTAFWKTTIPLPSLTRSVLTADAANAESIDSSRCFQLSNALLKARISFRDPKASGK